MFVRLVSTRSCFWNDKAFGRFTTVLDALHLGKGRTALRFSSISSALPSWSKAKLYWFSDKSTPLALLQVLKVLQSAIPVLVNNDFTVLIFSISWASFAGWQSWGPKLIQHVWKKTFVNICFCWCYPRSSIAKLKSTLAAVLVKSLKQHREVKPLLQH